MVVAGQYLSALGSLQYLYLADVVSEVVNESCPEMRKRVE